MAVATKKRKAEDPQDHLLVKEDITSYILSGWCQVGNDKHCPYTTTREMFGGFKHTYICECECHKVKRRVRKPLSMRRKAMPPRLEGQRKARRPE